MTATPSAEMEVCPWCSIAPAAPFENLTDNPDDPDDGEPIPVWTISHKCEVLGETIWVSANNPTDCAARWNRRPSSSIRREALEEAALALQEAAWATAEEAFVAVECAEIVRALANDGKAEGET